MRGFELTTKKKVEKTFEEQTVVCSFDEVNCEHFKPPATFCYKNAFGETVFVLARGRAKCQALVDENHGKGMYKVWDSKSY